MKPRSLILAALIALAPCVAVADQKISQYPPTTLQSGDTTIIVRNGANYAATFSLPAPIGTSLGGVQALTPVTHQFLTGIGTSGLALTAQPAATDITGLAPSATTDTTNAANITSGTLSAFRLPVATSGTLGIVFPGSGLTVGTNGALSVTYGTSSATAAQGNDSRIIGALQSSNNLSDLTNAGSARTALGLGSAATMSSAAFLQPASNLSDLASPASARTNLGLGSAATLGSSAVLQSANNLSDLPSPSTARASLGLGSAATVSTGTSGPVLGLLNSALTFSGLHTINLNPASLAAGQIGTVVQIGNANATPTRFEADSFASTSYFSGVRYDGTAASPTTLQVADEIGGFNAWGYNGAAVVGPRASVRTFAAQNWTTGANGTYAEIATTPIGTTAIAAVARFENDGGMTVPPTVTGGDKGPGTINASAIYVNGVALGTAGGVGASTNGQLLANVSGSVGGIAAGSGIAISTSSISTSYPVETQTGTTISLGTADLGHLISTPTTGSKVVNFQISAVQAGFGSTYELNNNSTSGADTFTPLGTDTVNAASSFVVPQGVQCAVVSDGVSDWKLSGGCGAASLHGVLSLTPTNSNMLIVNPTSSTTGIFGPSGALAFNIAGNQAFTFNANGLSIGTATPLVTGITLGTSANTIQGSPSLTLGTAGSTLTVRASGSYAGTDQSGGNLILAAGVSTGTGSANVQLKVNGGSGSSSTNNSDLVALTATAPNGYIGIGPNTTNPTSPLSLTTYPSNSSGSFNAINNTLQISSSNTSATFNGSYTQVANYGTGTYTSATVRGAYNQTYWQSNSNVNTLQGGFYEAVNAGTGTTSTSLGVEGHSYTSAGPITLSQGVYGLSESNAGVAVGSSMGLRGGAANGSSGVTSAAFGAYHTVTNAGTGSITAGYGNWNQCIESNASGTMNNCWGVYVAPASNSGTMAAYSAAFMGGNVGIGTATPLAALHVSGGQTSAAWGTNGVGLRQDAATFTDNSSSGTVTGVTAINAFAQPTLVASTGATTYAIGANVYISGAPISGTNVTQSQSYALYVGGPTSLAGTTNTAAVNVSGAMAVNSGATFTSNTLQNTSGATLFTSNSTVGTASGTSTLVTVTRTGANANASHTAVGEAISVSNTGTTNTNTALTLSASGGTNNYALLTSAGSVGIGTSTPVYNIDIGGKTAATGTLGTALTYGYKQASAPGTAPGAGICVTFWVAGTNAGSGKMQAMCGTSTTPVTIIDNVGAGF